MFWFSLCPVISVYPGVASIMWWNYRSCLNPMLAFWFNQILCPVEYRWLIPSSFLWTVLSMSVHLHKLGPALGTRPAMSCTVARLGTGLFSVPQVPEAWLAPFAATRGQQGSGFGEGTCGLYCPVWSFKRGSPWNTCYVPMHLYTNKSSSKVLINCPGLSLGPQTQSTAETEAGGEHEDPPNWGGKEGALSGGGMDWELGIRRYKLLYIAWIDNKLPRYSTGNCTQYPVINHNGKEYKKECIYKCIPVTLLYSRNSHNIVIQLYFNKIFVCIFFFSFFFLF